MKKILSIALISCVIMGLTGCKQAASSSTFTAKGKGYGGEIEVTIEVKDQKIVDVKIVGDKETPEIGSKAVSEMPEKIIKANSYDVDVVSGATITSTAIKKITKEAMESAGLLKSANGSSPCEVGGELSVESVNEFLNNSADMGEGSIANVVAVIPFNHIDGPRNESNFYAFVNFKYATRSFIKYQITYLSCTCRSAAVNYWQTAYVELSLPASKNIDDAEVRTLSFDKDAEGHYLAGFWGDSNPTPAGATYEQFKDEFIPFFEGKNYAYIKTLSVIDDIEANLYSEGEGREKYTLDTFTGSSVSTNNIIRMLSALYKYHETDPYFAK